MSITKIKGTKVIIVPKDFSAQERLDYDEATDDELLKLKFEYELFINLWKGGFFEAINNAAGCNIDDFEYEGITAIDDLEKVIHSEAFNKRSYKRSLHHIIDEIQLLFNEAIERKTSIHFFF